MRINLFHIGNLEVHSYGLMIAIGILAAYLMTEHRLKKMGQDTEHVFNLGVFCVLGGILGAKLLYLIVEIPNIIKDPSILLAIGDGFVVYGGIIGGIGVGIWYCKWKKLPFWTYLDAVTPTIALAQGFGRIGCFLAGCCYGRETTKWYGVQFPENSYAPSGVKLIPTQAISSVLDFCNFFILTLLTKRMKSQGQISALYLIFYSLGRFFLEYLRADERGGVGVFSTSQFISLFIVLVGVVMFVLCGKYLKINKRNANTETEAEQ